MNYLIGVSTSAFSSLDSDIIEMMELASINGFNSIEVICSYPDFEPSRISKKLRRKLREKKEELGLEVLLHAPFYSINIADFNKEIRELSIREIIDTVTLGYDVGASTVTMHAGLCFLPCKLMYREAMKQLIESLSRIVEYAEEMNVKIALEIRANDFDIGRPSELLFVIKEIRSRYLGITFDTTQAQLIGDPIEIYHSVKKYCINSHIRDSKKGREDMLAIGEGEINFNALLSSMKKEGFTGPFIFEVDSLERAIKSKKELLRIIK